MHFIKTFSLALSIIVVIMVGLFNLTSYEENPIKPEIEYGRRDYVWEVDSLDVPLHS